MSKKKYDYTGPEDDLAQKKADSDTWPAVGTEVGAEDETKKEPEKKEDIGQPTITPREHAANMAKPIDASPGTPKREAQTWGPVEKE